MTLRVMARRVLPPAGSLAVLLAGWWMITASGTVPTYLLPEPARVGETLVRALAAGDLASQALATIKTTLLGYLGGCLVAFALAAAITLSRIVDQVVSPLITAFQSVPKIALGPLLFLWFGFGESAIIALAMMASYFPVLVNTLAGLRARDPELEDLYRVHGAAPWRILLDVRLPGAARQVFAGLELAIVFALIGNIVMEFLIGTQGLGFVIQDSANRVDLPLNFAAIVLLGALGMSLAALVRGVGRRVVFWEGGRVRGSRHA